MLLAWIRICQPLQGSVEQEGHQQPPPAQPHLGTKTWKCHSDSAGQLEAFQEGSYSQRIPGFCAWEGRTCHPTSLEELQIWVLPGDSGGAAGGSTGAVTQVHP